MSFIKKIKITIWCLTFITISTLCWQCSGNCQSQAVSLEDGFKNPPVAAKPGVYWIFMDGNYSKGGLTKDLEGMVDVGISHVVIFEVNVGVPRGTVDLMSTEWKDMIKHLSEESERLGVQITLGIGPGWTGSGGPWVKPEESMQHLVSSSTVVDKAGIQKITLPKPNPKTPYFGMHSLTPEFKKNWEEFYEDVAVLAFPTPGIENKLAQGDVNERALYYRAPYTSRANVKEYLPMSASYPEVNGVKQSEIVDITSLLQEDGTIEWDVPQGKWTIMRFGSRNNGAITRPAPHPGLGMEADKFDTVAMFNHMDKFVGDIFRHVGFQKREANSQKGGFAMLHMDSWEMGAQNWTQKFREEFMARRAYDPLLYFPAYDGVIVESREVTERFLWDMRITTQELILENHAGYIKQYTQRHGLGLSIEPYDMNPTADIELGAIATVPMAEFWSEGYGFNSSFSAFEATSLAHIKGQSLVPAEAFTAARDGWNLYPGKLKNQTDWALASGINRLMFHTFQHQHLPDNLRPGVTMGPHGVHWDRNQTWWEMGKAYHDYVSRSQFLLQQGSTISDILYLAPEGNPHVFRVPNSAIEDFGEITLIPVYAIDSTESIMPDKRGYGFDATPPSLLYTASVKDGNVTFPSGATYEILVLPYYETMTPELLSQVKKLILDGATVVGMPPMKSPSLVNYPECDGELAQIVKEIWGEGKAPKTLETRNVGKGKIIWGEEIVETIDNLYPHYDITASILESMGIPEDFFSDGGIRYAHRTMAAADIYFVSNRIESPSVTECNFRITGKQPELWNPVTGEIKDLTTFSYKGGITTIPMEFDTDQSFFIVFRKNGSPKNDEQNFIATKTIQTLEGAWKVAFDPKWGGPSEITFDKLIDWTEHPNEGIKYYSGTAIYNQIFEFDTRTKEELYLDLGQVNIMAKVWLNDREVGTVWTYPWMVDITDFIKRGENDLKIEVVNLWVNRLIGDDFFPYDGIEGANGQNGC